MAPNQKKLQDVVQTFNLDAAAVRTKPNVIELSSSSFQAQTATPTSTAAAAEVVPSENYWYWEADTKEEELFSANAIEARLIAAAAAAKTKNDDNEASKLPSGVSSQEDYWSWSSTGRAAVAQESEVSAQTNYWDWETPASSDLLDHEASKIVASSLLVDGKQSVDGFISNQNVYINPDASDNYWNWCADTTEDSVIEEDTPRAIAPCLEKQLHTEEVEKNLIKESETSMSAKDSYWTWKEASSSELIKELYPIKFNNPLSAAFIEHQLQNDATKRSNKESDYYWNWKKSSSDDVLSTAAVEHMLVNNGALVEAKKLYQNYWLDEGADVIMARANEPVETSTTPTESIGKMDKESYWRWE